MTPPPVQTRTYANQAEYEADIARAAASGWVPVSQAWDGVTLTVTFGRRPASAKRRVTPVGIVVAVGVVGFLWIAAFSKPTEPAAVVQPRPDATSRATTKPTEPAAVVQPRPDATSRATTKPTPVVYAVLGDREWAQVVKSPDDHDGEPMQVWACITQFDAATGTAGFRGQALNRTTDSWFGDGGNAVFSGDATMLNDYVKDDVVSMNVLSRGSIEYDTQIGGRTVAPAFEVMSIKRRGSC